MNPFDDGQEDLANERFRGGNTAKPRAPHSSAVLADKLPTCHCEPQGRERPHEGAQYSDSPAGEPTGQFVQTAIR